MFTVNPNISQNKNKENMSNRNYFYYSEKKRYFYNGIFKLCRKDI